MEGFGTTCDNTISDTLPKLVPNVCLTTCLAVDIGPTITYNVYNDTITPAKRVLVFKTLRHPSVLE